MIDPISLHLHRRAGEHGPVMLMYHAVVQGGGDPSWPWAVSVQRLREQLDFLHAQGYATPTMGELVRHPDHFSGRTAVITFDDGYVDNLEAWRELEQRKQRATWFVVTGSIGREPAWKADGRPKGRLLDSSELRAMHSGGMEIGSHTVSHARLTDLDEIQVANELERSKAALEDMLGNAVDSFAYPYGAWDERCAQAVRHAGYRTACTTRTGWALRDGDPYRLRRLTVFNTDTTSTLARKLYLGSHDVRWSDIARYASRRLRGG